MYTLPCPDEDILIEYFDGDLYGLKLIQLGSNRIEEFLRTTFIVFKHYLRGSPDWKATKSDFKKMLNEETPLFRHGIYLAIIDERTDIIVAGVRGVKWEPGLVFPSQIYFSIDPSELAHRFNIEPTQIGHGSQTAIDEDTLFKLGYPRRCSNLIFNKFVLHTINILRKHHMKIMLAETDLYIERKWAIYGLKWEPITDYGSYFGNSRVSLLNVEHFLAKHDSNLKPETAQLGAAHWI